MHDNTRLPEPGEFVGKWRLTGRVVCDVELSDVSVEAANAYAIVGAAGCLEALFGQAVVGWRPAPDGLDLVRPDRLSAAFLPYDGEGAAALLPGGRVTLRRLPPGSRDP